MSLIRFQLYKITDDEILETEQITPEDLVLVYDREEKNIYLYKGHHFWGLDEFQSQILYEQILNRFLNPNIFLIKNLGIQAEDKKSPAVIQVKKFIIEHYPNLRKFELKYTLKNIFTLQSLKKKLKAFKNYENSWRFRKKLSNLGNIWYLSLFNLFSMVGIAAILIFTLISMINQEHFNFINSNSKIDLILWSFWLEKLGIIISVVIFITIIGVLINVSFVIFPMHFPIDPKSLQIDLFKMRSTTAHPRKFITKSEDEHEEISKPTLPPVTSIKAPKMPPLLATKKETKTRIDIKKDKAEKIKKTLPQIQINLPSVPSIKAKVQSNIEAKDGQYDELLNIPPPPLKKKIEPKISTAEELELMKKLSNKETKTTKYILIDCPICKKNLAMPVPKKWVLESDEPVVEVSYLHGGDKKHVLVAQLDHDFNVRRRRASWVVFEEN